MTTIAIDVMSGDNTPREYVAGSLLALSDDGSPSYDHSVSAAFAELGIPAFACTPDLFPDLMAAAINRTDLNQWAATHEVVVKK